MASGYTEIFAWGGDHFGQLGLAGKETGQTYAVPRFCSFNVIIAQISCGEEHTGFLTNNGLIYTIGNNADGRLGVGDRSIKFSSSPCLVEVETKIPAANISCGWGHTAVAFEDGSVYTWGLGDFGVLGTGETASQWTPARVPLSATTKANMVSCGSRHTALVTYLGELWMCGSGDAGQLGTSRRDVEHIFTKVPFDEEISQISCGIFHTGFVTRSGKIFSMGGNTFGQLGINSKKSTSTPTQVSDLSHIFITKVACGHHTACLSDKGDLYIWGSGIFGEFLAPQKVISLKTPIKDISIGGCFGSAIDTNGMVWTWGSNASGELGVGDYEPRVNPFPIVALQGKKVTQIDCGGSYAMALGLDINGDVRRPNTSAYKADNLRPSKSQDKVASSNQGRSASPIDSWRTRNLAAEGRSPLRIEGRSPIRTETEPRRFGSASRVRPDASPSQNTAFADSRSPLRMQENRQQLSNEISSILATPHHDAEKSTIQNYLVDLKKELRRLHEGAGGIDELSSMLEQMQIKNDDLRRENSREQDRRKVVEDELVVTKSRAEQQIMDLNERNLNTNQRLERKIEELEHAINERGTEQKVIKDMNSRLNEGKVDAENEAVRLQQVVVTLENRLDSQIKADRDTREFLESRLSEQERQARESRNEFENRIASAEQQHRDTRESYEKRLADADRIQRDTQDSYEMRFAEQHRQHQDQASALENAKEDEAGQRRKLEYDLDMANSARIRLEEQVRNQQLQIDSDRADIQKKQGDLDMQNETINRLNMEISNMKHDYEGRICGLEGDRTSLLKQVSDQNATLDRTKCDLIGANSTIDRTAQELNDSKRANEGLSLTLADTRRDLDLATAEKGDLTLNLANSRNEVDMLMRQIQDLKARNDGLLTNLEDTQLKADRLNSENTDSRSQNTNLTRNLDQMAVETADLRRSNSEQKMAYDLQMRNLEEMKASNDALNRQYTDLANENSMLTRNIDSLNSEATELRRVIAEQKHDNEILNRSLEESRSSNDLLNRQNSDLARENNDMKLTNDSVVRNSSDVSVTNTSLARQNDGLIVENESLKSQNMVLQRENDDMKVTSDSVSRDNHDLQVTNDAITRRNDDLAADNEIIKRQIDDLQRELNGLQSAHSAASNENSILNQRLSDFSIKNDGLNRQLSDTLAEKDDLSHAVRQLDQGLAESQNENTVLKHNISDVEDKNKKLFQTMEKTLADRAREYRDQTSDILQGRSPLKSPLRATPRLQESSTPQVSRSPLIDKYANASSRRDYVPHNRSVNMQDQSREYGASLSPLRQSRPSLESQYVSSSQYESRASDLPSRPDRNRRDLSREHQDRIAKSANNLLKELAPDSPLRDMRVSSPSRSFDRGGERPVSSPGFQHKSSAQLKNNLSDIKSKLTSLQENKAALEDKMAQFEAKLKKPEDV